MQLKELEEHALVTKKIYPVVPPEATLNVPVIWEVWEYYYNFIF